MKKIINTSSFIRTSLTAPEKRMFAVIKRDLLKQFILPKNSDLLMIDIIACEYIKYARSLAANQPRIAIASAKALREYLAELNLTPKSSIESNTGSTLSNIFKVLNNGSPDA